MQSVLIKAGGLYTFPNHLSSVPSGALLRALNININRDNIIEPRRGFAIYGTPTTGGVSSVVHQMLTYKGTLLRHYGTGPGNTLEYDSDQEGTFLGFQLTFNGDTTSGSANILNITTTSRLLIGMTVSGTGIPTNTFIQTIVNNNEITLTNNASATATGVPLIFTPVIAETSQGLRIKSLESNGNLYMTTASGIKKISIASASDFSTAVVENAGIPEALDVQATLNGMLGFLNEESTVAYRVLWGITDPNQNEILGSPSSRAVIYNSLTPLLANDFNNLLTALDAQNVSTGIHAQNYHTTYSLPTTAPASAIRANLIALAAGIDNDIPGYTSSGSPTVTGTGPYTVTWTVTSDPTNKISIGDVVQVSGITPTTFNTVTTTDPVVYFAVSGVTSSSITYTQTTDPGSYSGGTASIKRRNYENITQPVVLDPSPTTDELQSLQNYYTAIVNQLSIEPTGIATNSADFATNLPTMSSGVTLRFIIPQGITTADFFQIYRTAQTTGSTGITLQSLDPGDEEQLVFEGNPTATDLNNGFIQMDDITPDSFRGANLYTNQQTGDGITQANTQPPLATDITMFKGYIFYSNTQTKYQKQVNMLSVTQLVAGVSTFTISDGTTTNTYTFSTTENASLKEVLISTQETPAQQVDESARSLVRVINENESELVYAYYLSGPADVPGLILFKAKNLGQNPFFFTVNDTNTTGTQFDPMLPNSGNSIIATNEVSPNRIYYSKYQQPDAVPIVNFQDVGPKDKKILRILALRDNLFIMKEDSIYRLTGTVAPFTVSLFDSSTLLKAPDSAVVLNNLIYCYSTQGVAQISDTGVSVISRPIEDQLLKLNISAFSNFNTATFGVAYESDRSYYLSTVSKTTDLYASQLFKYNTFTQLWTAGDLAKTCGIVDPSDDKLYFGASDINFVEQERKSFDRTDYADREQKFTLGSNAVNGNVVTLSSVAEVTAGDIMLQIQYLTLNQFNQLLLQLDQDRLLQDGNYFSTLEALPDVLLNGSLDALITKIANDPGRTSVSGSTPSGTYTSLSPSPSDFSGMQDTFNSLITLLNADVGIGFKQYLESTGTVFQEVLIENVNISTSKVTLQYSYPFIQGPLSIFNNINCDVIWCPQYLQDPSMTKQISEGTILFEDSSYSTASVYYSTDLSPNFEEIDFTGDGNGNFGNSVYGSGIFGGNGAATPFRTYIPLEKQRCRYMNIRFQHGIARELFSIYGVSLTFNMNSQRGYR